MAMYKVLILGASYGSLLGIKLAMAGHEVTLVCLPAEAEAINRDGALVRLPVKGREPIEIRSKVLPGKITAAAPGAVNPADYDLVGLAMQEPQYGSSGVRELMGAIAKARVPCMSIMNMPPLTYLKRIPALDTDALEFAYTDPACGGASTLPHDPVQSRPASLPATRQAGQRSASDAANQLQGGALRTRRAHRGAARHAGQHRGDPLGDKGARRSSCRSSSRCTTACSFRSPNGPCCSPETIAASPGTGRARSRRRCTRIRRKSRAVYDWVCELCIRLGAAPEDLVVFEKYAAAAQGLVRPSSAARALFGGAPNIERVDRLVLAIAAQVGLRNPVIEEIVSLVDAQLERNRRATS